MKAATLKEIERIGGELDSLLSDLQTIWEAEQEKYDNLSEKAQETEKGEAIQSNVSALDNAVNELQSVIENLNQVS